MRYWYDAETANREIDALQKRNALLERMAKDMARRCGMRWRGQCDLDCLGRAICDATGLTVHADRLINE